MLLLELAQWKTEANAHKHLEGHCVRKNFPLPLSSSRSEKVLEWERFSVWLRASGR